MRSDVCDCNDTADEWEARLEGRMPSPMQVTVPIWLVDGGDDPWAHGVVCTGCAEVTRID